MESGLFPPDEYERRWAAVNEDIAGRGFDTAVVWGRGGGSYDRCGDALYLTNYYSCASGQEIDNPLNTARSFYSVILRPGEVPELIVDEPEPRRELIATDRVSGHSNPISATARRLVDLGTKRAILCGSDFLPMRYWSMLEAAAPGIDWTIDDSLVQRPRRIKSARELDRIREAGAIASRSLDRLMDGLVGGLSEAEAVGEAVRELLRSGATCQMIPVAHGAHTARWATNPFTGCSTDVPKDGDLVRGWLDSMIFQGYWLDPGRTAVAGGKPSAEQRALIENCMSIVDGVIDAIRPDVSVHDVARLGDELSSRFAEGGSQMNAQWPLYGHGTGLYWEHPYIGLRMSDPDDRFAAGMVLGIEAFLHVEGMGTAAHEENLIVLDGGNEIITTSRVVWW